MSGKNVFWIVLIFVAAFVGAFIGPALLGDMPIGVVALLLVLILGGTIGFVVYSLSGNRGGAAASGEELASARAFAPADGKGRIYIIRRGFVAALQGMNVEIDGVFSGQIKSKQFLMAELDPGTYRLSAQMARAAKAKNAMAIELRAGEAVAIQAFIEMGAVSGKVIFERVEPPVAKAQVATMKMLHWSDTASG
ncbi:DUF2846 domain-containing protein [Parasphingopyxis marina]|uniref:DUF2846 domain-containing protein n=1 Tax=Parasphingopyxis marina TaxID=2761622 RepID=A0A842HZK2_9SPHN|nr:DUF2846 domain-containing protein [Parasphingopyxis marina]MBC2777809.1 DUF2846 domain-containing protein [Parasphingopyxis marina]